MNSRKPPRRTPRSEPAPSRPARPDTEKTPRPTRPKRDEVKYHGTAACLALWRQRPHDVIRVYVERERLADFGELLKWCAAQRKAYHVVEPEDLERLTETVHHGGICILALEHKALSFENLRANVRDPKKQELLIYLDGIENPHNLGAILRSCAHFGVRYVLGAADSLPRLSPSACRIAEGGAEYVTLVPLTDPVNELRKLNGDGYTLIGTAVNKGTSVYGFEIPPRAVIIMGAEQVGMSRELRTLSRYVLRIPGSEAVESLNVSVACGVFCSEYFRRYATQPE